MKKTLLMCLLGMFIGGGAIVAVIIGKASHDPVEVFKDAERQAALISENYKSPANLAELKEKYGLQATSDIFDAALICETAACKIEVRYKKSLYADFDLTRAPYCDRTYTIKGNFVEQDLDRLAASLGIEASKKKYGDPLNKAWPEYRTSKYTVRFEKNENGGYSIFAWVHTTRTDI